MQLGQMSEPEEQKLGAIRVNPKVRDFIDEDASAAHGRFATSVRQNPLQIYAATLNYLTVLFGIHAHHHVSLLSTPDQVRDLYYPYLAGLTEDVFSVGKYMTENWAAPLDQNRLVRDLRGALSGGASDWKAAAFKFVRETESAQQAGSQTDGHVPDVEPRFSTRASWLQDRLRERAWNSSDPHRQRGPDRKTVQKILRGEPVRDDVLEKLANALSMKFAKVDLLDIPQN